MIEDEELEDKCEKLFLDEKGEDLFTIGKWILSHDEIPIEYCVLENPFKIYDDQKSNDYVLGMKKDGSLVIIFKNKRGGFISAFMDTEIPEEE